MRTAGGSLHSLLGPNGVLIRAAEAMAMQVSTYFKHTFSFFGLAVLLLGPACSDDTNTSRSSLGSESETGGEEESASNSGDGDGDTTGDDDGDTAGDGDTSGDGDGDLGGICGDAVVDPGEACDDGVNDGSYGGCSPNCMSLADYCGDGTVNGPEACDDANDDSADGCLGNCKVPASCLGILGYDDQAASGPYLIGPVDSNATFEVDCDMTTEGGGWTGLSLPSMCNGDLVTTLNALEAAPIEGIDAECRPFTQDAAGGHAYQWDIEFPPGYDEFYLSDYVFKANAVAPDTTDIWLTFTQTDWDVPYNSSPATGDVAFGSPGDVGPTTSYGAETMADIECTACETPFPVNDTPYAVAGNSTVFRISWGEYGGQYEGFYPWWSGTIYLR